MSILSQYKEGLPVQSYTDSVLLAANVPEFFTVPTDQNGKKAKQVLFGKGVSDNFYAQAFSINDSVDRVTNGTFAEYVTNGAFTTDTAWTKGPGWTIAAGVATATGAISTSLSQNSAITLIPGYIYTITFTITAVTAGSVTPSIGGTAGTARSTAATFTETIIAGATQTIAFTGAGFSGSIDNVTITAWVLGTGWTTDGVTAIATGAISTSLSQTANYNYQLVAGQAYLVTFTLVATLGSIAISVGGTAGTSRSTSGTFTEVIIAGSTQAISFATTGFTGTVDNVSIKACASVPVDASTGLSAMQNPPGMWLNENVGTISVVSASTPTITATYYN